MSNFIYTIAYNSTGDIKQIVRNDGLTCLFTDSDFQAWNAAQQTPTAQYSAKTQSAIIDFKNYIAAAPATTQSQLSISVKQDQFNRDVIAALAYINSQLTT